MINQELVRNKMSDILGYLVELDPLLAIDSRDIIEDSVKLHAVERLLQLVVDTAIDINTHIITESKFTVPEDYYSTFLALGENKILPMDFALKIAPSVGLRNLIVHKYGRVDVKRMVDDVKSGISDYPQYLKYIDAYLG